MNDLKEQIGYFNGSFVPFGGLDITRAVEIAIEVGEDGEWAAEQVANFAEDCEMRLDDCDPVGCVYETILEETRQEIEDLTGFDFVNDGAEIWVASNFLCTTFDYTEDAIETLTNVLNENKVVFEDLSVKTQWFLNELGISLNN